MEFRIVLAFFMLMDNQFVQKCPERIRHSVHISFGNSFRHLYLKSLFCLKILIKKSAYSFVMSLNLAQIQWQKYAGVTSFIASDIEFVISGYYSLAE